MLPDALSMNENEAAAPKPICAGCADPCADSCEWAARNAEWHARRERGRADHAQLLAHASATGEYWRVQGRDFERFA